MPEHRRHRDEVNFPDEEPAFEAITKEMFAALDKPMTKEKLTVFKKSFANLSINQYARCRDKLLKNLQDGKEVPRSFGPANIWAIVDSLRSHAKMFAPPVNTDEPKSDVWDDEANKHFRKYIHVRRSQGVNYGHRDVERTRELLGPLLGYKSAWATDCREYVAEHKKSPPEELKKSWWTECMTRAEEQIKAVRERHKKLDSPKTI